MSKTTALTLNESIELTRTEKALWSELKDGVEEMAGIRDTVEGAQASAKALIILQGKRLIQLKKIVGHGEFGKALEKNCPTITPRTCSNYMRIAGLFESNSESLSDLSLVQLYKLAGIIPTDEPAQLPDQGQDATNVNTFTLALALRLARPVERLTLSNVLSLPAPEQWEVRAALAHAHEIYMSIPERPEGQRQLQGGVMVIEV